MLRFARLIPRMTLLAGVLSALALGGCGSMGDVGRRSEGVMQSVGFRGVPKQSEPAVEEAGDDRE